MQMTKKHDILYVNFYTDGSAARKIAPAFPESRPQPKPRSRKQKKIVVYVDPVAICSFVVAAVLLIMMAVGLTQFQNARLEAENMERYLQTLTAENEALSSRYAEEVNLEEVEKTALALGMVPKAEAQTVSIQLSGTAQQPAQLSLWDQIVAYLTNLFA